MDRVSAGADPVLVAPTMVGEVATALRGGEQDLPSHIDAALDRMAAVDPRIEALVPGTVDRARLQEQAYALLARHPDPTRRPPLFGVLLGVKDVFHVTGLPTAAGSAIPPEAIAGVAPAEAAAVRALREAGALIAGKTATAEFAYRDCGPTRNPHRPAHTPGGSSHGSAAGVAAGLFPLALGTQTIASTMRPAAYCGVAGFVPSRGRIPTGGVVPVSRTLDRVGLFTSDVGGLRLAAPLLVTDWRPTRPAPRPSLAVPEGPFMDDVEPAAWDAFKRQIAQLQRAGYVVRRLTAFEDADEVRASHYRLMPAEFARTHAALFAAHGDRLGPLNREAVAQGRAVSDEQLARDRAATVTRRTAIEAQRRAAGADLWVTPAACGPAPEGIASSGPPTMGLPWSYTGLPSVALPAGSLGGLPLGLQLVGGYRADEQLLAWAADIAAVLAVAATAR